MLANELDTARRILNEAPELQRSRPQLRYRLAQVDFRAGQYPRGLATLGELLDGGAARDDPMFRARLLGSRGAMLVRLARDRKSVVSGAGVSFRLGLGGRRTLKKIYKNIGADKLYT